MNGEMMPWGEMLGKFFLAVRENGGHRLRERLR